MILIVFILSFFVHFIYSWYPSFITSIFFPVNESVWEHMKIIYTSMLISSGIESIIYYLKKIKVNNYLFSVSFSSMIGIIIYLLLYLFLEKFFSHNFVVSVILLLFVYFLCQLISYLFLTRKKIKYGELLGLFLIIFSYILFGILTYYPPFINLFLDPQTNTYGI